MGRRTRRKTRGGAAPKPRALCQCVDPATGKGCTREAGKDSLYCEQHPNCPLAPVNGYEPKYDTQKWNSDPAVYRSMNCYAYFADAIDNKLVIECRKRGHKNCRQYFPQPGALNGERNALNAVERRHCPVVANLMMKDIPTIRPSSFHQRCPPGTSKGALVSHKGEDYHFYRQNPDGYWSHKDGSNQIKDFDALKRKIANPELAARDYRWQGSDLNYADFCGFYCVPRNQRVVLGQGGALKRGVSRSSRSRSRREVPHSSRTRRSLPRLASRSHRSSKTRRLRH